MKPLIPLTTTGTKPACPPPTIWTADPAGTMAMTSLAVLGPDRRLTSLVVVAVPLPVTPMFSATVAPFAPFPGVPVPGPPPGPPGPSCPWDQPSRFSAASAALGTSKAVVASASVIRKKRPKPAAVRDRCTGVDIVIVGAPYSIFGHGPANPRGRLIRGRTTGCHQVR